MAEGCPFQDPNECPFSNHSDIQHCPGGLHVHNSTYSKNAFNYKNQKVANNTNKSSIAELKEYIRELERELEKAKLSETETLKTLKDIQDKYHSLSHRMEIMSKVCKESQDHAQEIQWLLGDEREARKKAEESLFVEKRENANLQNQLAAKEIELIDCKTKLLNETKHVQNLSFGVDKDKEVLKNHIQNSDNLIKDTYSKLGKASLDLQAERQARFNTEQQLQNERAKNIEEDDKQSQIRESLLELEASLLKEKLALQQEKDALQAWRCIIEDKRREAEQETMKISEERCKLEESKHALEREANNLEKLVKAVPFQYKSIKDNDATFDMSSLEKAKIKLKQEEYEELVEENMKIRRELDLEYSKISREKEMINLEKKRLNEQQEELSHAREMAASTLEKARNIIQQKSIDLIEPSYKSNYEGMDSLTRAQNVLSQLTLS